MSARLCRVLLTTTSAAALALILPVGVRSASLQQNPASPLYIDFAPPPPTVEGMWQRASVVVLARVVKTGTPIPDPNSTSSHPAAVRFQQLEVIEVFKDEQTQRLGSTIRVRQFGGTIVVNGREMPTAYPTKLFEVGDEMVLFLGRSRDVYDVLSNDAGSFRIDSGTRKAAITERARRYIPAFSGKTEMDADTLILQLRNLRGRG